MPHRLTSVERDDDGAGSDDSNDGRDLCDWIGPNEHGHHAPFRISRETEARRHALRSSIEFAVGAVPAAVPNRERARVARDDLLEPLVDRAVQRPETLQAG